MSTVSRVIKNTSYLYLKMGITTFVTLYSTRLVLATLGESDFGVFHVVGGIISMLGFLNLAMANASYRFLSYAEGENNLEEKKKVFNISIVMHCIIALLTMLLLFAAMFPLFNGILNIEPDRVIATKTIYVGMIFSAALIVINVPYDAMLNAHENMLYYSLIAIFEALLRLGIAFACIYTSYDKLIFFGILSAAVPIVTLTISKIYCHKHYEECVLSPFKYWDYSIAKKMATFSGWSFLTAITDLATFQGIGVVLNHFYGATLNAAQGISNQVRAYLSTFSENMKKALNPVIMKKAGAKEYAVMNAASISGCKFNALMTLFFTVPFIIEAPYILELWLKHVPQWSMTFCVFQMTMIIITQMAQPLAISIYGMGNIKAFAIWKSVMNILPLAITYVCFKCGGSPYWLYIPMIVVWAFCGDIVVVTYAKKVCNMRLCDYMRGVVLPVIGITVIMFVFGLCVHFLLSEGLLRLVLCFLFTTIGLVGATFLFGLSVEERNTVRELIAQRKLRK